VSAAALLADSAGGVGTHDWLTLALAILNMLQTIALAYLANGQRKSNGSPRSRSGSSSEG
jgi:hypothetical protein